MRGDDGPKNLFAQKLVRRIPCLDESRLDEIAFVSLYAAARDDLRIVATVHDVLADFIECFFIDNGAHEVPEIGWVAHSHFLHDCDSAIAHLRPDRFGNVDAARRRTLLSLVLESASCDSD